MTLAAGNHFSHSLAGWLGCVASHQRLAQSGGPKIFRGLPGFLEKKMQEMKVKTFNSFDIQTSSTQFFFSDTPKV